MNDEDSTPKLEIDWLRTLAGALAAMTSAVVLSTMGSAGTIIGAAIGSIAATVGTAFYAQGLARSRAAVAKAQVVTRGRDGAAKTSAKEQVKPADEAAPQESQGFLDPDPDEVEAGPIGWRDRLALLPWKRIAIAAGALFVAVMVVILVFELLTGRSVASYTGGADDDRRSTIFDRDQDDDGDQEPGRDPTSEQSEDDPAQREDPTTEPSPTVSEDPASESPAPAGTTAPTEAPSPLEGTATGEPE